MNSSEKVQKEKWGEYTSKIQSAKIQPGNNTEGEREKGRVRKRQKERESDRDREWNREKES